MLNLRVHKSVPSLDYDRGVIPGGCDYSRESEMYNLAGFGLFAEVLGGGHVLCMQEIVPEFWTKNRICRWDSSSGTHILSDLGQELVTFSHLVFFSSPGLRNLQGTLFIDVI